MAQTQIVYNQKDIENVAYQINSNTFPVDAKSWDQMFVTTTWNHLWNTTEQWIYDGTQWFEIKTDVIEGTWVELEAIRSASELSVNKTYILTDYKHKYIIENSDSQPTQILTQVIGNAGAFAQLQPNANHLSVGSVVTITTLPSWYVWPITVGSTTTVTTVFNVGYMIFSPNINQDWFAFTFSSQRYSNVANNATINDVNWKPIIQPWGVLNTDVHNWTPYADMSALENYAVPTERIKLKALDVDKFSLDAESVTFLWDTLRYDFLDTNVKDVNGNITTQRNWFILWRYNKELDIWTNKDWRVQRYRRYLVDTTSFNEYNYVWNPLYQVWGIDVCWITKTTGIEDRYFLNKPEEIWYYPDLTSTTEPDPFLSWQTTRYSVNVSTLLTKNITIQSFTGQCKDYPIIELQQSLEPDIRVHTLQVTKLSNTIFRLRWQAFWVSSNLTINMNWTISNSTFHTWISMTNICTWNILNSQIWNNIILTTSQFSWDYVHHKVNGWMKSNAKEVSYTVFWWRNNNPFHVMAIDDNSFLRWCVFWWDNRTEIRISNAVLHRFYFLPLQVPNTPNGWLTITGNSYLTHISWATWEWSSLKLDNGNIQNAYKEELRTWTASITAGTTTVIWTWTLFTTELTVWNVIIVWWIEFTIQSITNDTSLTVTVPHTSTLTNQTIFRRFSRFWYKYNAAQFRATHTDVHDISNNNVRRYLYNEMYDASRQRQPFFISKPL